MSRKFSAKVGPIEKRYAKALLQLCGSENTLGKKRLYMIQQLDELCQVHQAWQVLSSPVMPLDLKKSLLDYALKKGESDKVVHDFINTVLVAGRIERLPGIIKSFQQLLDQAKGVVKATIVSATKMPENEIKSLSEKIRGQLGQGKSILVEEKVDPNILGGFVLRIGNALVDLSVKTKLEQIAKRALG